VMGDSLVKRVHRFVPMGKLQGEIDNRTAKTAPTSGRRRRIQYVSANTYA